MSGISVLLKEIPKERSLTSSTRWRDRFIDNPVESLA
jgi:hypothetical protein